MGIREDVSSDGFCEFCGDELEKDKQVVNTETGMIYCTQECLDLALEEDDEEEDEDED